MNIKFKLITGLALLGAMASPAAAGIIAKFNSDDAAKDAARQPADFFFIEEPPVWSHDPTVTVSKFTKHGSLIGGDSTSALLYRGWQPAISPDNYVGFTVTPSAGDTLTLTSLEYGTYDFSLPAGSNYRVGYRIKEGTGFGAWIYATNSPGTGRKTWTFGTPISTKGTVEIGFFMAFPNTTTFIGILDPVLNGTAGDTTPDPTLVGVISQYRKAASYSLNNREPSALTYNWDTDTLFCVGDNNDEIVEYDKRGKRISQMFTKQLKFPRSGLKGDPEALTYLGIDSATGRGRFMIGAERENVSMILEYYRNGSDTPDWMTVPPTIVWGPTNSNIGLEGLSYDSRDGSYYGIKEKGPTSLIRATNVGTPQQTLTQIDLNDVKWRLDMHDISDLFVMSNSAAYAGSDHIILLARAQQRLIEITKDGTVVDSLNLASLNQRNIEGIVIDDDGVLYLCSDGGGGAPDGTFRSGDFHVLTKPMAAVTGTGGRQTIAGTAASEEIQGNQASDVLRGGGGADVFIYRSMRDGVDTIMDFTPGQDFVDLSELLVSVGYTGQNNTYNPFAFGGAGARMLDSPGGAVLQINVKGAYRNLVVFKGLTAAQLGPENFRFITSTLGE